jgi:hypothetical protein
MLESMFFVKAVVTGFAHSLGVALFKKVQHRLGLGEPAGPDVANPGLDASDGPDAPDAGVRVPAVARSVPLRLRWR